MDDKKKNKEKDKDKKDKKDKDAYDTFVWSLLAFWKAGR